MIPRLVPEISPCDGEEQQQEELAILVVRYLETGIMIKDSNIQEQN